MNKTNEVFNYCYEDKFEIEDNEERRIYINDTIDEAVISTAVYHILRYNRLDKDIPIDERKPIYIFINTFGGSVIDGFGLVDAITLSKTPVITINLAACFSMGLYIFMAGHKRYAMPHSEFLLHDGQTGDMNSVAKVKDRLDFEMSQVEKMIKDFVISHSDISEEIFEKNYRREWYFLPNEGKKLGIVDYIIGEDCEVTEILN